MADGEWTFAHGRHEYTSDAGVIGCRSSRVMDLQASVWWNHMPAVTIKSLVGDRIWNSYLKFCTIRNPFEQMISVYHNLYKNRCYNICAKYLYPSTRIKQDFENWLLSIPLPLDRNKYFIDEKWCLDTVIRFESLVSDIERICRMLNIDFQPDQLPHLKNRSAPQYPVKDYYSDRSIALIQNAFRYQLDKFGYALQET